MPTKRGKEVKKVLRPLFKLEGRLVCVLGGEERNEGLGERGNDNGENYRAKGGTTPICFLYLSPTRGLFLFRVLGCR